MGFDRENTQKNPLIFMGKYLKAYQRKGSPINLIDNFKLLNVILNRFKGTLLGCKLDTLIVMWWFQFWKCFSTLTILGKHLDDGQTEVNGHYPLALFLLLSPVHSEVISSIMAKAEMEKKSQFENVFFFFWYLHLGNSLTFGYTPGLLTYLLG